MHIVYKTRRVSLLMGKLRLYKRKVNNGGVTFQRCGALPYASPLSWWKAARFLLS